MMSRRFTRLTTGFSKKREAHRSAVSLFVASYNFCWRHSTLRMSSAMRDSTEGLERARSSDRVVGRRD
jgi:hypothetical protein